MTSRVDVPSPAGKHSFLVPTTLHDRDLHLLTGWRGSDSYSGGGVPRSAGTDDGGTFAPGADPADVGGQ